MFKSFKDACERRSWDEARNQSQGKPKWRAWASSRYGITDWFTTDEVRTALGDSFQPFPKTSASPEEK